MQFIKVIKHRWLPFDDFYTDHPFIDWYKTMQDKEYSQHFSRIGVYQFWECSFTQIYCAKG